MVTVLESSNPLCLNTQGAGDLRLFDFWTVWPGKPESMFLMSRLPLLRDFVCNDWRVSGRRDWCLPSNKIVMAGVMNYLKALCIPLFSFVWTFFVLFLEPAAPFVVSVYWFLFLITYIHTYLHFITMTTAVVYISLSNLIHFSLFACSETPLDTNSMPTRVK